MIRRRLDPSEFLPRHPVLRLLGSSELEGLVGYAWDGRRPTPATFRTDSVRLDIEALGLTEDTLVYLPFDEGAGPNARDVANGPCAVEVSSCSWDKGVGHALYLPTRSSHVRLTGVEGPLLRPPFTVELLLRVDGSARKASGVVLEAAGVFSLHLERSGRLRLRLENGEDVEFESAEPVAAGWNRVAVRLDGPDHPQLGFLLNFEVSAVMLREPLPPGAGRTLSLAGADPGDDGFLGWIDELRIRRRAVSSAELVEGFLAGAPVGEHVLELRYETGSREERFWAGALLSPSVVDWETEGVLVQTAARDGRLVWTPAHWERDRAANRPRSRTTHPTVFVGDHRAFVFGGETRDTHMGPMVNTGDTWIYHIDESRWQEVATEVSPSPRCHQAAAYSPDHRMVLLAGGVYLGAGRWDLLDDTWAFLPDEGRWERREPSGAKLPPIGDCGLVYHAGARRFVLFRHIHVHLYDPEEDRWEERPLPRIVDRDGAVVDYGPGDSFMMGYDPNSGRILLFGGRVRRGDGHAFQDATALYDLEANELTVLAQEESPSPRVRSGFALDPKRGEFVLFGGVQDQESEREGDLWVFRMADERWVRLEASNPPSPRGGYYGMAYDPELEVFSLLCGRHAFDRFLDEAWRLRIDPSAEGSATYCFDRAAFPDRDVWYADFRTEGGAVDFLFSGSKEGLTWSGWSDSGLLSAAARFVKVQIRLRPRSGGPSPEVLSMGFARESELPPLPEGAERRTAPVR